MIVQFQKISIPTRRVVIGNTKQEGGVSKFLRESMKQNWKFPGVGGSEPKTTSLGEVLIFLEPHIVMKMYIAINNTFD